MNLAGILQLIFNEASTDGPDRARIRGWCAHAVQAYDEEVATARASTFEEAAGIARCFGASTGQRTGYTWSAKQAHATADAILARAREAAGGAAVVDAHPDGLGAGSGNTPGSTPPAATPAERCLHPLSLRDGYTCRKCGFEVIPAMPPAATGVEVTQGNRLYAAAKAMASCPGEDGLTLGWDELTEDQQRHTLGLVAVAVQAYLDAGRDPTQAEADSLRAEVAAVKKLLRRARNAMAPMLSVRTATLSAEIDAALDAGKEG